MRVKVTRILVYEGEEKDVRAQLDFRKVTKLKPFRTPDNVEITERIDPLENNGLRGNEQ